MGVGGQRRTLAALPAAQRPAPTGIRSPDRPACSESLHQLHSPGPC